MSDRVYRLPAHFYDDHVQRDNDGGEVVRRTSRAVVVRVDAGAYIDLHSDAAYYAGFAGEDYAANRGLVLSARAVLRQLDADPFPPDELEVERERQAVEWAAGADERAAEAARVAAIVRAAAAERDAERAAHPRVEALYTARRFGDGVLVLGVAGDAPLIVGARIASYDKGEQAWRYYDVRVLGERHRGNVPAQLVDAAGAELDAVLEVC